MLLTGPNGAGKEVLADVIQANSSVRHGPFIKVNVGALPAELMESELFGAEAGAYTGADHARAGRFEAADGGTLFLDEIGNLLARRPGEAAARARGGTFERLGSAITRPSGAAASWPPTPDLKAAIRDGRFREDLYYRISVIELKVPPLAARPGDILPLARRFLAPA